MVLYIRFPVYYSYIHYRGVEYYLFGEHHGSFGSCQKCEGDDCYDFPQLLQNIFNYATDNNLVARFYLENPFVTNSKEYWQILDHSQADYNQSYKDSLAAIQQIYIDNLACYNKTQYCPYSSAVTFDYVDARVFTKDGLYLQTATLFSGLAFEITATNYSEALTNLVYFVCQPNTKLRYLAIITHSLDYPRAMTKFLLPVIGYCQLLEHIASNYLVDTDGNKVSVVKYYLDKLASVDTVMADKIYNFCLVKVTAFDLTVVADSWHSATPIIEPLKELESYITDTATLAKFFLPEKQANIVITYTGANHTQNYIEFFTYWLATSPSQTVGSIAINNCLMLATYPPAFNYHR